jgi:hypothetical protein
MELMSQVLTYSTVVFSNGKNRDNPLKITENQKYLVFLLIWIQNLTVDS